MKLSHAAYLMLSNYRLGAKLMFYSDKPISSINEDCLNRRDFAKLLASTFISFRGKDTYTVGLFGKWGSGKTSLVNMVLKEIEDMQSPQSDSEKMTVIHFEPWNFWDTNQLLSQFFIRISNELQSKKDRTLQNIGQAL